MARRALLVTLVALAGGCSSPQDTGAPPPTPDEQRALADAKSMIPASELPPPTATPTESAPHGQ